MYGLVPMLSHTRGIRHGKFGSVRIVSITLQFSSLIGDFKSRVYLRSKDIRCELIHRILHHDNRNLDYRSV
jgi:hypothetical protein